MDKAPVARAIEVGRDRVARRIPAKPSVISAATSLATRCTFSNLPDARRLKTLWQISPIPSGRNGTDNLLIKPTELSGYVVDYHPLSA